MRYLFIGFKPKSPAMHLYHYLFQYVSVLLMTTILIQCIPAQQNIVVNNTLIGGPCEGCEALFEYDSVLIRSVDTLVDFELGGNKIYISGTVYKPDGKTPASDVILYVYHTNQEGIYEASQDAKGWEKRHGKIRSWLKTDDEGRYGFYTLRPGIYPNRREAAHIHFTIGEPNGNYYWINSIYFDDDPLLNEHQREEASQRGGQGNILHLKQTDNLLSGERDIILGLNVDDAK